MILVCSAFKVWCYSKSQFYTVEQQCQKSRCAKIVKIIKAVFLALIMNKLKTLNWIINKQNVVA